MSKLNTENLLLKYQSTKSTWKNFRDFSLNDIKIEDKHYLQIIQKDIDFLNTFDPDRLLYNFRLTAGFTDKLKVSGPYSGWENTRIGGHTMGHYLAAAAQGVASGYGKCCGKDGLSLENRLSYLIGSLLECQKNNDALCLENPKRSPGFIFGATMADSSVPELQFDKVESDNASDTWVPWYTMHKIMNGLVETYKLTGNITAMEIAENLGEWIYKRTEKWTEEIQDRVLGIEYGGMNDCLYELYKCAKKTDYVYAQHFLTAAHKFDQVKLFERVNSGNENVLNNQHANCTIPKYMGALNRYITLKDESPSDAEKYLEYTENFWNLVVNHHTYITGGNSECEHFGMDNILDAERSNCNCETCNTHNMLKITRELYKITGEKKYADYYENTFLNAIMASVNPESGMTTYFQPMATGCFKNFCNPDVEKNYFWCCTGTGLENFTKLGDSFYYYSENQGKAVIAVNIYVSSAVTWKEKGITLSQKSNLPVNDTVEFTVKLNENCENQNFGLLLRVPDWVKTTSQVECKVNGQKLPASYKETGYVEIFRDWKNEDSLELILPLSMNCYSLPDNPKVLGFKYGPLVLAAGLGTDSFMNIRQVGVLCDVCAIKVVNGQKLELNGNYGGTSGLKTLKGEKIPIDDFEDFVLNLENNFVRKGSELSWTLKGPDLKFEPYYAMNNQRYGIYWLFDDEKNSSLDSNTSFEDEMTEIDGIGVGYGAQTEGNKDTYPCMEEKGNGSQGDPHALNRYAKEKGSFSYLFEVRPGVTNCFTCGFLSEDDGKTVSIKCGNQVILEKTLDSKNVKVDVEGKYFEYIELSSEILEAALDCQIKGEKFGKKVIRISFEGIDGAESARIVSPARILIK